MHKTLTQPGNRSGFTLLELMIVIAIIAILAAVSAPSFLFKRHQTEVTNAYRVAVTIRDDITEYYLSTRQFPEDNEQAGQPKPDKLVGNKITRIEIEDGVIHITLGNKVADALQGKIISMRPAVVKDSPASPISWLCGHEQAVEGMQAVGEDRTDISPNLMPASCDG